MSTFGQDILTVAVEGGIGYWAEITDCKRLPDLTWVEITVQDAEGEGYFEPVTIKATQLEKAAAEVRAKGIRSDLQEQLERALKSRDAGDLDADVADCIVQHAAFGEVMFG